MSGQNREIFERATQFLPGGNTRTTLFVPPSAPYVVHGDGARVRDAEDHVTIDCNNNYTSLIHGHRPQRVLDAVASTLEWGVSFGLPTPLEIEMAEALSNRILSADLWRFGNSGTEAVMQAIRIARAKTGRDVLVRFTGSYHGTGDPVVDSAAPGIPTNIAEVVKSLPYGDIDEFTRVMKDIGHKVAAVLVDLMPNRVGMVPATRKFAESLRALTKEYGALLIVDEVISFRLAHGGLQEKYGIRPDLTTLGKVIGGGFPIGAVGGSREVMQITDPRTQGHLAWGGTFSANPVAMGAGLATLMSFGQDEIDTLNDKGNELRHRLEAAGLKVNGTGSLMKVWPPGAMEIHEMWWSLYRAGVQAGSNGMIALSTAMTDADIDEIDLRIQEALLH